MSSFCQSQEKVQEEGHDLDWIEISLALLLPSEKAPHCEDSAVYKVDTIAPPGLRGTD